MPPEIVRPQKLDPSDPHPNLASPRPVLDFLQITLGCALAGITFNVLLRSNGIASGGVVGMSLLMNNLTGIEPAYFQWFLNLIILFAALKVLGKNFAIRSLVGMLILPLVVFLTRSWPPLTENLVLAALTGGAGLGIGMGLVFRANGSVGGFSTLTLLAHRKLHIPVDRGIVFLDGLVILGAMAVFRNAEQVLGSILCVFLTGRVARAILTGMGTAKMTLIITNRSEKVIEHIFNGLLAGVTRIPSEGAFLGTERSTLLTVTRVSEIVLLKRLVRECDPKAFVIVCDTAEVLGYGFKPLQ
ncbi:YitT family protein [Verrucomicrobiaceae bacterium 227]